MFNSKIIKAVNGPSCKSNKIQQIKAYNVAVNATNSNTPDYLKSSNSMAAYKRESQVLMNKNIMNLVIGFQELNVFNAHLVYRSRMTASYTWHPPVG